MLAEYKDMPARVGEETGVMQVSIDRINAMDRDAFVKAFGGIFEHSPWVAERAWQARPFADIGSVHDAMKAVYALPREGRLRCCARPRGQEAEEGTMTDHSARAGQRRLDAMTGGDGACAT